MAWIRRVAGYVCRYGVQHTLRRAGELLRERVLHSYDRACIASDPTQAELAAQRTHQPDAGLISVVIPVYNTRPVFLRTLAESLTAQTYQAWEAILFDGSDREDTIRALDALQDSRIRVIHGERNFGLAGNTNEAISHSSGAWVALCDHDDTLPPDALWHIAKAIEAEQPDMIYSDEDKLTVSRARKIQRFLSQPFSVAEQFTGMEGKYVPLKETIRGFKEIIEGKHDDLPESAFLFVGSIDEAVEKAKQQG